MAKIGQFIYPWGNGHYSRMMRLNEKLKEIGLSRQKIKYVRALASAKIDYDGLEVLEADKVIEILTDVLGIGRWTAEMFLIFTLRRTDVFPVTDLGVQKGFQIFYSLDKLPTIEMMNQKSESWRPYRTIMSLYLWYAVEGPFEW